ncbi:MAG: 2-enoyl thioester reductase domain-containing protein [Verrucomicrobiaceae bacterium]|nr:2-enoyl thioester reductase domain-containing protein [Verrucomicrobiaceae bacterium]
MLTPSTLHAARMATTTSGFLKFTKTGNPAEVLEVAEREVSEPKGHEVRVRMRYAPVNPADLNFMEGTYGRTPVLPCIPGHEGCGEVEAVGPEVKSLEKGDVVISLLGTGCWAQHLTAPEHAFAKVPARIDPAQASMLRINPVTAWIILKEFAELEAGSWVVQNAANSGVGRALIQIAKRFGLKTLNFVRREELFAELRALGADEVVLDTDEAVAQAKTILGKAPVKLAANAVGGDSAIRLMDVLSSEGVMVTYGAMSRRSLKVPNKFLIFKNLSLRGLWVTKWFEKATREQLYDVLEPLTEMILAGELVTAIDEIVPFRACSRAIQRAQESGRAGKVLLDFA